MSNKNTPNKLKERKATVKKTGNKKYEVEFVNNTAMVVDTAASTVSSTPQPPLPNMPMPVASSNLQTPPNAPVTSSPPSSLPLTTPNLLNSKKEANRRAAELRAIVNTAMPKPKPSRKNFGREIPVSLRNNKNNTTRIAFSPTPPRTKRGGSRKTRKMRNNSNK